jgi:uncharacterized RDD family membrane protein YckC
MNRPSNPTATPPTPEPAPAPAAARARVIDIEDPMVGRRVGHFHLRSRLGQGELATVYLADDLVLEQPVAVKVLHRAHAGEPAGLETAVDLLSSARQQARVSHQNVAGVRTLGAEQGRAYIVAEHVPGQTLRNTLARDGAMAWEDAVAVMIEIVRALQAAQAAGVFHGALTSSNVFVSLSEARGEAPVVKVADFGGDIARAAAPYLAPELERGAPATLRGDLYALGVLFHEMLTAVPPQAGRALPERAAPAYIRRLVAFLMRPEARQRPSGYDELMNRLDVALVKPSAVPSLWRRATAFAIDLAALSLTVAAGMILLPRAGVATPWAGGQIGFAAYALYWVIAHKVNRQSLGKRVCGLRLQKPKGLLSWWRSTARFVVQFWAPLAAVAIVNLELGSPADLSLIGARLGSVLSVLGVFWVSGLAVVLVDRKGTSLADHATDTSVIAV